MPWIVWPVVLLILVVVVLWGFGESIFGSRGSGHSRTKAIIDALDQACKSYRLEYGVYPPADREDSRCLHYYLGRNRRKHFTTMAELDRTGPTIMDPPILDFPQQWLQLAKGQVPDATQPVPIIDEWGNPIKYANPGRYNKGGVDIWSWGRSGGPEQDTYTVNFVDVISNWVKEY
jgi:hypothetical protein